MENRNIQLSEIKTNRILLGDFDKADIFSRPLRNNHLILVLCTQGEIEVEVNYVSYRLKKNSLATLLPLDFKCKALLLTQNVYSPMIANLDISHFKELKQIPVVTYEETFFNMILQLFTMLEKAKEILAYEDFEAYTERMILASFVLQKSYIKRISKDTRPLPGVVMRKRELFRKFVEEIVNSHTVSREVLFYANELGVSAGYLNEVCNEVSTHSAKEIIDSAVASRLKYELSYTGKTIQELSDEYNFPSQSYFSRYYKRLTGMTPSEFRKKRNGVE